MRLFRSKPKKLHDKGDGVSYSSLLDEIVGCGDMVLLDPLTEDKVVENLKLRYSKKDIYVRTVDYLDHSAPNIHQW